MDAPNLRFVQLEWRELLMTIKKLTTIGFMILCAELHDGGVGCRRSEDAAKRIRWKIGELVPEQN